jgi:hypothetical protein
MCIHKIRIFYHYPPLQYIKPQTISSFVWYQPSIVKLANNNTNAYKSRCKNHKMRLEGASDNKND